MISDLRFVDTHSPSGQMQTREILLNIGTSPSVVDWVLDTVREERSRSRELERRLYDAEMAKNE